MTANMDSLEAALLDTSGNTPLDQRFRTLFTIKGIANESDQHLVRAIDIIGKGFADDSALLKHELAYCLGQLNDARALPTLERVLRDVSQDAMVRHEAAEAMGAISSEASLPVLNEYLADGDVSVRETCELAISKINFDNSDAGKREKEEAAIRKAKGEASAVESAFTPIDPAPAAPSKDLSAVSVPSLRGQLLDTKLSLFERYRAMFALRNVAHVGGEAAEKAVLALADGLRDESALFRHEICFIFGELSHPASVPSMLAVLGDRTEHEMVRHEAAEALGGIAEPGQEGERVLEVLKTWAEAPDTPRVVRESCVVALDMFKYENDSTQFQPLDGIVPSAPTVVA